MSLVKWKCPSCWTEYEIDSRYQEVLVDKKNCVFCVRKHANIPTVAEMDGFLNEEEMRNRHTIVLQCQVCNKWTAHERWVVGSQNAHIPCTSCDVIKYDSSSIKSLRSYNPLTDNKRRIKNSKRK